MIRLGLGEGVGEGLGNLGGNLFRGGFFSCRFVEWPRFCRQEFRRTFPVFVRISNC